MRKARKRHACDVEEDQRERDVGNEFVGILHSFTRLLGEHSGKRSSLLIAPINDETRHNGCSKENEKHQHNGPAPRAMPKVVASREMTRDRAYTAARRWGCR